MYNIYIYSNYIVLSYTVYICGMLWLCPWLASSHFATTSDAKMPVGPHAVAQHLGKGLLIKYLGVS
jgi:hypothetical protein